MVLGLSYLFALLSAGSFIFSSIILFVTWQIKKKPEVGYSEFNPPVSIIIPTHNEENWIKRKLENTLSIEYSGSYEVIVTDDGSKDKTLDKVREFGERVMILSFREHRGKVVNMIDAVKHAKHDIVIGTDATAAVESDSIEKLVRHLADERVGAVSSNLIVCNPKTYFEKVDCWVKSHNSIVRRIYGMWGCSFLEGSLYAIRKQIFEQLDPKAFYEDRELSITSKKMGYDVVHEEQAKAYYLSPSSIRDFRKQKRRTLFGIARSTWKHKNILFNPRWGIYGLFFFPEYSLERIIQMILAILSILLLIYHSLVYGLTRYIIYIPLMFLGGFIIYNTTISSCTTNPLSYIKKSLYALPGALILILLFPLALRDIIKRKDHLRWSRIDRMGKVKLEKNR